MGIQTALLSFLLSVLVFWILNEFVYPKLFINPEYHSYGQTPPEVPLALPFYLANYGSICWNVFSISRIYSAWSRINNRDKIEGGRSENAVIK